MVAQVLHASSAVATATTTTVGSVNSAVVAIMYVVRKAVLFLKEHFRIAILRRRKVVEKKFISEKTRNHSYSFKL